MISLVWDWELCRNEGFREIPEPEVKRPAQHSDARGSHSQNNFPVKCVMCSHNRYYWLRNRTYVGGFSVFAGVGERTREGNDLYKEMIEGVSQSPDIHIKIPIHSSNPLSVKFLSLFSSTICIQQTYWCFTSILQDCYTQLMQSLLSWWRKRLTVDSTPALHSTPDTCLFVL